MIADANKLSSSMARNLEQWSLAVKAHDRRYKNCRCWGIGLHELDMERLGVEDGEVLWGDVAAWPDGGDRGEFRVLCDKHHGARRPSPPTRNEALIGQQEREMVASGRER